MPSAPTSASTSTRVPSAKPRLDVVPALREPGQAMVEMDPLGGHRGGQRREEIGAMHL